MIGMMQAAVLYGKEDVRLEQVPIPEVGEGEVLVKIGSALTCGTDLKVFRNGSHARMIRPPALFGHEFAGTIQAVGPKITRWKAGQRVVAANSAPCRLCLFCQKGKPNLCRDLLFVNGAYAQFLRLPARIVQENLLEIPDHLSFQKAALTEPLACVLRGIQAVSPQAGETAVVLGTGPVGLFFIQLARRAGAQVIAVGKGRSRQRAADACGAQKVLDLSQLQDPLEEIRCLTPEGIGPDLCIEAVGRPEAWKQALALARPGGRVLLFGGCPAGTQVPLDAQRLHYEELSILSVFHHTPEAIRESLKVLSEGAIRTEPILTAEAPLSELPQILRRMLTESDGVKTAILP